VAVPLCEAVWGSQHRNYGLGIDLEYFTGGRFSLLWGWGPVQRLLQVISACWFGGAMLEDKVARWDALLEGQGLSTRVCLVGTQEFCLRS
jgi:hypothetical protein